ncbi:MAG: MotA/TolQ/ExbB proton channel family protein [Deltaproteobacteria bacterium]|nr:MAG: MotA/TolQ/ExbB proton channel family protein [Deltaproteobacteria bacterium]
MMEKLLDIAGVGGTVVLVLLLALSVISIGIILERFVYFRRRRIDAVALAGDVLARLAAGDLCALMQRLRPLRAVEAEVLRDALAWYDAGPEAFTEILKKGLADRRRQIESGLVFLGTLGNNAPFVGLFGTVLGIIVAFRELSSAAASVAGGTGNMNNVMSGIAEALVSTAVGILVAVPAVIFFNIFQKKTVVIEDNIGALGNAVCAQMTREARGRGEVVAPVVGGSAPTARDVPPGYPGITVEAEA